MLRLWLMRHGEAGFEALRDEDRTLTARGEQDASRIAEQSLADRGGPPSDPSAVRVVCSPLLRTRQTATRVCRALGLKDEAWRCSDLLIPDADPRAVLAWLEEALKEEQPLWLVTHQPLIGRLLALLVDGDSRRPHPMAPASLAALRADVAAAGCFSVEQLLHAR